MKFRVEFKPIYIEAKDIPSVEEDIISEDIEISSIEGISKILNNKGEIDFIEILIRSVQIGAIIFSMFVILKALKII